MSDDIVGYMFVFVCGIGVLYLFVVMILGIVGFVKNKKETARLEAEIKRLRGEIITSWEKEKAK